jgi:integrase/recombinase XerD
MKAKNGLKKMTMTKGEDIPFLELKKRYLKKCLVNNLSDYTLKFYETCCNTFNKFICLSELMASDVTRDLMDDYILHLKSTGIKAVSINTYVNGISPIVKYGMSMGLINEFGFKEIKTTEEIKQVYTHEELKMLLEKPQMSSFAEYRNWVIINFLMGTGIRALELRSIKIKDVDLTASMLLVSRTKNRRQRYIPISRSLNKFLLEYLDVRKAENAEEFLFCNEFGQYLPRTTLQMAITKYCTKRGVYKHSLHLFRHTFDNMWILNQGDIFSLQKILGHSSLKQVNHYANLAMDDVKRNFGSFCALESVVVTDRSRIHR